MQAAMSAVFISGACSMEQGGISSPAAVLSKLNRVVYANSRRGHFVAFLLVSLDVARKSIRFSNAGQSKPLLVSNGEARWLDGEGVNFPLGMLPDSYYKDHEVQLKEGDTLLLLTDGITEAMNANKEMFGQERIEQFVQNPEIYQFSSSQLIERFTERVRDHIGGAMQHDDMTLVVLRVR
jgi:sigma-B regulation protein RsbU (phosphoserine phosphatase)